MRANRRLMRFVRWEMHTARIGLATALVSTVMGLGACGSKENESQQARAAPVSAVSQTADFRGDVLASAAGYRNWVRVSDGPQWAPELCLPPQGVKGPRFSESKDANTHGRKLYYLFCNQHQYYYLIGNGASQQSAAPVGLTIVKEAHRPNELDGTHPGTPKQEIVSRGGKMYEPGPITSLFVMTKYDAATPGTDQGWVYATLDAAGQEVTGIGVIASCVECHRDAKHDRLFGLNR